MLNKKRLTDYTPYLQLSSQLILPKDTERKK